MSVSPDTLLDRILLKRKLVAWRLGAILAMLLAFVSLSTGWGGWEYVKKPYIARIAIADVIVDNPMLVEQIKEIGEDRSVKAVLIYIDSPGGTVVGGEQLYRSIRDLSDKKPTAILMRTMATSAAYMAAVGGEKIYAMEGTITGSIGVLLQTMEVTELAKKMGVKPITIKSSPLKATPSPLEKLTPEGEQAIKVVIDDFYHFFVTIVAEARELPEEEVLKLADGRIYTGRQALKLNLIDEIGGEKEALDWLYKEKGIDKDLEIEQVRYSGNDEDWVNSIASFLGLSNHREQGLLSIWKS